MAEKKYEMKKMTIEQMENFASENNLKVKDTDSEIIYALYDGRKKMYEVEIIEEKKKQVHVRTGETCKAWSGKDSKGISYKIIYRKSKDRAELWKAEKDEEGKLHRNRIINKDIEQTIEAYQKFAEGLIAEADGKKVAPKRKTKTAINSPQVKINSRFPHISFESFQHRPINRPKTSRSIKLSSPPFIFQQRSDFPI